MPAPTPTVADQESSSGLLHVERARSPDERAVGRAFSSAVVELALASYPGFFATSPPGPAESYGVYWPALVSTPTTSHQSVVLDDGRRIASTHPPTGPPAAEPIVVAVGAPSRRRRRHRLEPGEPLGRWFGARSGDKGGNANVGIWARDDAATAGSSIGSGRPA